MATTINHMYKDATPSSAPEGSALYILNGVYDDLKALMSNEKGFEVFSELGSGQANINYCILGSVAIDDGSFVVALARYPDDILEDFQGTSTNPASLEGEIGVINRQGTYNKIIGGPLNFTLTKPLRFTYKRNLYNERTVVFTDKYNPPRLVNLDNPPVGPGEITSSEVSELKLFRDYNVPNIEPEAVESGGALETGAYFIFSMYEDENGNTSDVIEINNPIYITESQKSDGYAQYSGSEGGVLTNKSILLNISNLDDRYRFLVLGAISVKNGTLEYFTFAKIDTGDSTTFRFLGNEERTSMPAEEVLQQNARFDKVGDLVSTDKVLYLANVQREDVVDFQKYANNIKIDYSFDIDSLEDIKDNFNEDGSKSLNAESYKNPIVVNAQGTFMPGEVYAAYIWFVLKSGTISRAFHIPGRPPQEITTQEPNDPFAPQGAMENDTVSDVKSTGVYTDYLGNDKEIDNNIKYFRTRDTSDNSNAISKGYSNLAFWENENEYYPDTDEWDIYDENGKVLGLTSTEKLRGNKVRHHKMPYYGDTPQKRFFRDSGEGFPPDSTSAYLRTIKLEVKNLFIPNSIREQIQEVRIGFAKRDSKNSTVVGQSILFPSAYYTEHPTSTAPNTIKNYQPPAERSHPFTFEHTMLDGGNGIFKNPGPSITEDLDLYSDYNLDNDQRYFKVHPFDMLIEGNRIGAQPSFISTQDAYQVELNPSDAGLLSNNDDPGYFYVEQVQDGVQGSLVHVDLTLPVNVGNQVFGASTFSTPYTSPSYGAEDYFPSSIMGKDYSHKYAAADQFQKVHPIAGSSGYVEDNTAYPDYANVNAEKGFIFKLKLRSLYNSSGYLDYHPYFFNKDIEIKDVNEQSNTNLATSNKPDSPLFKLVNVHNYRTNIYSPFEEQQIFQAKSTVISNSNVTGGEIKKLEVRGGDCVLSDFSFRATTKEIPKELSGTLKPTYIAAIYTFFCITTNNANYRQEGTESHEVFYPKLNDGSLTKKEFLQKSYDKSDPFIYNKDYTQVNDFNVTPIRGKFDKNRNRFETLIARSEQDTLEKQYEPWRNFRAEDFYKLLDLRFGGIRNIDAMGERLIINLDSASFITYGQSQLNTNQENAYIGVGNIFRDRPKEIVPVETGYAGTQSPYSCISTEFGYAFYDADKKVFYQAGDGAEELSEKGLRNFFYDNMRLHGAEQLNQILEDSPNPEDKPLELHEFDNPLLPTSGMGFVCGYDRFYNRIIITKRDFVIKESSLFKLASETGSKITYTSEEIRSLPFADTQLLEGTIILVDGALHQINPNGKPVPASPIILEDRSETLSYSLRTKKWESHHSYVPSLYQNHRNSLYSFQNQLFSGKGKEKMHEHNVGDYGVYFNITADPFEVALPVRSQKAPSFLLSSILLMTYALNEDGSVDPEATFDELVVSNSTQSSGIVQLTNLDTMRRVDRWFRINKFRDMVKQGAGFLDLGKTWEPDQSVLDQNKRWFNQQHFIDQYQILKFRYTNSQPAKALYLQMVDALIKAVRR